MKTIAFFGHRQILNTTTVRNKLINTLETVVPLGFSRLLIVCHGDFDRLCLTESTKYKNAVNKSIEINVIMTSLSYLNKKQYFSSTVDLYNEMNCNTLFYDIENVHFKNRITYSNKKMIDSCDLIVCYVDLNLDNSGAKKQ